VRRGRRAPTAALLALGVLGMVVASCRVRYFPLPDIGASLAFLALVVWAAQRDLDGRNGVLTRRSLVVAGEISFAFYLVHELVLLNVAHVTGLDGWRANAVMVPAACVAAVLLHRLVERPCERRLRSLQGPPRRAADPSPT
jgi:peptidoglycan/LPS O-acetylase OafA/YrhL